MSKKVFCHGCKYFFITHRIKRPWGCKKFGFISKILPSLWNHIYKHLFYILNLNEYDCRIVSIFTYSFKSYYRYKICSQVPIYDFLNSYLRFLALQAFNQWYSLFSLLDIWYVIFMKLRFFVVPNFVTQIFTKTIGLNQMILQTNSFKCILFQYFLKS